MTDLPKSVEIIENGPREGLQIEAGPIPTERKIALIDALSGTGVKEIQTVSFVNPKRVPAWVDADAVVSGITIRPGVRYTALYLNDKGLERALAYRDRLTFKEAIVLSASEKFLVRNQNADFAKNDEVQHRTVDILLRSGLPADSASVQAAFGCNFEGDVPVSRLAAAIERGFDIASAHAVRLRQVSLNDTMGWATPQSIKRTVGAVRERWPDLKIILHLHDTRGLGIANAWAGLEMGVDTFDASLAGLGGCPFAGNRGAAGNVCTEDLVFLCEEAGISTGVDLDRLIEAAILAEEIVGHPLPGSVMHGGTLNRLRQRSATGSASP
jgi:hydroxymethylglutaryl-CoA lyase